MEATATASTILPPNRGYYIAKCVIVGDADVGKTSLAVRFTQGIFGYEGMSTIGVEFYTKTITTAKDIIKYHIWDTAGQEKFRSITNSYYRGASCVIICFSVKNKVSFDNVHSYYTAATQIGPENAVKVLVGTFEDARDRQVTVADGLELAKALGMEYIEVSSKTGSGVDKLFEEILPTVMERLKSGNKLVGNGDAGMLQWVNVAPHKKKCC